MMNDRRKIMCFALILTVLMVINLMFPAASLASGSRPRPPDPPPPPRPPVYNAAVTGIKFNDLNSNGILDAGEPVRAGEDVFIRNTLSGAIFTCRTDANGRYSSGGHHNGTFKISTYVPSGWQQTTPTQSNEVVYLVQNQRKTLNIGIVRDGLPAMHDATDACANTPTMSSVASGDWNDPNIWDAGVVPGPNDWINIEPGHSIVAPNLIDLEDGGLCIRETATLRSGNSNGRKFPPRVEIHAASVHNSGDIIGQNGSTGRCGRYNTAGSSIQIWAGYFVNDVKGKLQAGNGGHDTYGCGTWTCPARGGNGGSVEIFSTTAINEGIFRSGNGGHGFGCHAPSFGGNGGNIWIIADIDDPNNQSKNTGFLVTGRAGDVKTQAGHGIRGKGGDFNLYLAELGGTIEGKDGSVFRWDPVKLKANSDLQIKGSDIVEIYTDKNGTIDLTGLSEGAISATKTITIAAGEGGKVDLRGLSGKVFQAGETVDIFSDEILTDEGNRIEDISDAPDVLVSPAKTLYRVALAGESFVTGDPGETVSVPLRVMNNGSVSDTYTFSVSDSEGWDLGRLSPVTVDGFSVRNLTAEVTLPVTPGETNTIIITAISQSDPEAAALAEVNASVNPGPDSDGDGAPDILDAFSDDPNECLDWDGDGLGNNADADDDNDGIPDEEEEALFPGDPDEEEDSDETGNHGETRFEAGVFTVGSTGVVQVDWLFDGGLYEGELGLFSLSGMEALEPGTEMFIAEAVRRVLSGSVEGRIVLSDRSEGARFSGSLGESEERNEGPYSGMKIFRMRPGDRFATILTPGSTFNALANNPGTTDEYIRPLFSLVSPNPVHGMYLGQIADISGMGMAFAYEDMSADNSDRDYNDLIIQIFGVAIDEVPTMDELKGKTQQSRSKQARRDWFDWRTNTELGGLIMGHLDAQIVSPETVWLSADIDTGADLMLYTPDGNLIGEKDGHIPGMTFGFDCDGHRFIRLPLPKEGDYRLALRSEKDETAFLTVRKHRGENEILSEERADLAIRAHSVLVSDVSVTPSHDDISADIGDAGESPAGPYDFDGNGEINDADIDAISALWNICDGDEGYEPFYDLDDDGCITVLDIMRVVNSR